MSNMADDSIQKAMEEGKFDNLSGAGKPFIFEQDRLVPEENRLAYRIMRDNDIQPEWISLQKEIERAILQVRETLEREARHYRQTMLRLADQSDVDSIMGRIMARDQRDHIHLSTAQDIQAINRKIVQFNLKVPFSHLTRDLLDAEREFRRFFQPE